MQETSSSFINLHLETPIYRYKQALEGISIECLVIVLYSLFPVLLLLGHARCRFDIASDIFWTKTFFYLKASGLLWILQKKKGKKNDLRKRSASLSSLSVNQIIGELRSMLIYYQEKQKLGNI